MSIEATRPVRRKSGMSLIEATMGIVLVLLILFAAWRVFMAGMHDSADTTREVALMVGVRGLMENLTRDVNQSHCFLPVSGNDPELGTMRIQIVCYPDKPKQDIEQRLARNVAATDDTLAYPMTVTGTGSGSFVYPWRIITYFHNTTKKTISRKEETADITFNLTGPNTFGGTPVTIANRQPARTPSGGTRRPQETATEVQIFQLTFMGYDLGTPAQGSTPATDPSFELRRLRPDQNAVMNAACLGILLRCGDPEVAAGTTPPARPANRKPTRVDMCTKIWSLRKATEAAYPEYWSSVDEDLRF